jgi:hypothetical protein
MGRRRIETNSQLKGATTMSKQIQFVVYYDTEDKKFWLDDETLMSKFGTASWFDTELEEWVQPENDEEEELDFAINNKLANILQPKTTGATLVDYEKVIADVLDSISEMRKSGDYDEDTLETLEWRLSAPNNEGKETA